MAYNIKLFLTIDNFSLGLPTLFSNVSSIRLVLLVYHGFCLVRTFSGKKILHETIFTIRLDTRRPVDRSYSELLDHPKHIRRIDMVSWIKIKITIQTINPDDCLISICSRFIVPVSMIVINDIMAYVFGFFFGRTPLIKLSPKKTWEGFVGGGISTVILGLLVSIKYKDDYIIFIRSLIHIRFYFPH